jgi:hypothetical protein
MKTRTRELGHHAAAQQRLAWLGALALVAGCYQGIDDAAHADGGDDAADGGPAGGSASADGGDSDGADGGGDDGADDGAGDDGEAEVPFEPLPPEAALAKVKDFLTGLPPTSNEQASYLAQPQTLPGLVDAWMKTPEFQTRSLEMFDQLFQQQVSAENLAEMMGTTPGRINAMNTRGGARLLRSISDSFSATVWDIVANDRPFTEILTTRTFMLNVPQMVMLSYIDADPRGDDGKDLPSWVLQRYAGFEVGVRWTGNVIPQGQTFNPDSANFMRFWLDTTPDASCQTALGNTTTGRNALLDAFELMFRVMPGLLKCGTATEIFSDADWQLRPVTLRVADAGEDPTAFFDVPGMRTADELVLHSDRVGYFTTLGFSVNWLTNDSNQHRVNANQALIVGLGRTFDPENVFVPADGATVDEGHAEPGSPCYSCHKDLDPLRDFLRQSYTYAGSPRPASEMTDIPGSAFFSLDGSDPIEGSGAGDLAGAMASHERFASAWTEKMCTMINSDACDPQDPELIRIAGVFADSNYDFRTLLRELLTSPIVTFETRTRTGEEYGSMVLPVTQDRFCLRMSQRLGVADICNLEGMLDAPAAIGKRLRALSDGVPPVSYGRAAVLPFVNTEPDVFSVASTERICQIVAERWYGDGDGTLFTTAQREEAIDAMVEQIIGIPKIDARYDDLRQVLADHWDLAIEDEGVTPVDALRSTFITACASSAAAATAI